MAERIGDAYIEVGARITGFQKKMARVSARMRKVGSGLARIGKRAGIALGAGIAAGAAISIKKFIDFEAEMRNVNVIGKQSEEQFKATSAAVLDLSREMGKPPTELAAALYNINSAGFVASEGLGILEAATVAGRAGLADTATAAKVIAASLNAYGKSADEAGDVSDILFKTVEKGVITFTELAANMGAVTSSAAAAKVPFDQVAAAMATMTKGGIDAAEASTSLNKLILAFLKPSKEMEQALVAVGAESGAALLKTKGLAGVMQFLQQETGGDAEQLLKLNLQMRDFKAAASLARESGAAFAEDLAAIADETSRAGATQAAFEEQSKSVKFQMDKLRSTFSVLAIQIGEKLAPTFAKIIAKITEFGNKMIEVTKGNFFKRQIMFIKLFWVNVKETFKKIWSWIKGVLGSILEIGIFTFATLYKSVENSFQTIWLTVKNVGMKVVNFMKAVWRKITHPTEPFQMPPTEPFVKGVKKIWEDMPELPTKVWTQMHDDLRDISEKANAERAKINEDFMKATTSDAKKQIETSKKVANEVVANEKKKRLASKEIIGLTELWRKTQEKALEASRGVAKIGAGLIKGGVIKVTGAAPSKEEKELVKSSKKAETQRDKMVGSLEMIAKKPGGVFATGVVP